MTTETKELLELAQCINSKLEELDNLLNEFNARVGVPKKGLVTLDNRKFLKRGLAEFYGSIPLVVEETKRLKLGGYKAAYVRDVLSGRRKSTAILIIAAEVLCRLKVEKSKGRVLLNNLSKSIQSA